jgi:hypothetical protein
VVVQPARRTLSTQARLFLDRFEAEVDRIHELWDSAMAMPAIKPKPARRVASAGAPGQRPRP